MTRKNKIYVTSGFFSLLAILLVVFVISPLFRGIAEDAEDFIMVKEKIVSMNVEAENIESLKTQYQGYEPNLEKINLLFINAEVPIDFIRFLEKLAADSNISAEISSAPGSQNTGKQWQSLKFRISAQGTFLDFSRFLEKLENAPYFIEVQNLNVEASPVEDGKANRRVSADFIINVFAK